MSSPGQGKTVLIVEDNADLRRIFANTLVLSGYVVQQASDGVPALQMIENERPDVVILDIHLPTLDGISVRDELVSQPGPRPAIMFVTGFADTFEHRLRDTCFLRKPVSQEQLLDAVQQCLLLAR